MRLWGGLKNVYAVGAGMIATTKSLQANQYILRIARRNAWNGQMLAKGELTLEMGDSIKGKVAIQSASAERAFYELLSRPSLSVLDPERKKHVAPTELCPILETLHKILI
ncbi:hypothetical protein OPV22_013014 [Ensete ventricosum]|uniref:Uncharacterized protein n=1 Tax=Ensete ventricosum TaxID=4639 RepID=A0AAV8R6H2_ENSVE|nr:hypothetical protein OPV22_013014 [Ensete ventricosum]